MSKTCPVCGFVGDKKLFKKNFKLCKKCLYRAAKEIKEAFIRDSERREKLRREYAKGVPERRRARWRRSAAKRKVLGHDPVNAWFKGSEAHHLHLNGSKSIVMFIPRDLHRSIRHSGRDGKGMREINKAALLWLCEQSTILPEKN